MGTDANAGAILTPTEIYDDSTGSNTDEDEMPGPQLSESESTPSMPTTPTPEFSMTPSGQVKNQNCAHCSSGRNLSSSPMTLFELDDDDDEEGDDVECSESATPAAWSDFASRQWPVTVVLVGPWCWLCAFILFPFVFYFQFNQYIQPFSSHQINYSLTLTKTQTDRQSVRQTDYRLTDWLRFFIRSVESWKLKLT